MSWQAAGVRHAVLLRILPVLSHDLATPISVLRMTAMVLRRKLGDDSVDSDYCVERLATLDQQTDALSRTLKLLGGWGPGGGDGATISRPELVEGCVALLQPLMTMRDIELCVDPALQTGSGLHDARSAAGHGPLSHWPKASSLRYLLLASICYLQDVRPYLERIDIRPDGDDALRLVPFSRVPPPQHASQGRQEVAGAAEDAMRLDSAALECLASDLERSVRLGDEGVWLRLGAG